MHWLMLSHCNYYFVIFLVLVFLVSGFWLPDWKAKVWNMKESTDNAGICSWDKTAFLAFSFGILYWCIDAKTPLWHLISQKDLLRLFGSVLFNVNNSKRNGVLMWKCLSSLQATKIHCFNEYTIFLNSTSDYTAFCAWFTHMFYLLVL